jgi:lipoyl-dependent peroxiredoxin
MPVETLLYTAHATATGGRDGRAAVPESGLDLKMTTPKELGGKGGEGTNPEQLFAAGYSACFIGAMRFVGQRDKIAIPADVSVDGAVGVGLIPNGFGIQVELKVSLPGMAREQAHELIEKAHAVCPYSNATRNNIDVTLTLV